MSVLAAGSSSPNWYSIGILGAATITTGLGVIKWLSAQIRRSEKQRKKQVKKWIAASIGERDAAMREALVDHMHVEEKLRADDIRRTKKWRVRLQRDIAAIRREQRVEFGEAKTARET